MASSGQCVSMECGPPVVSRWSAAGPLRPGPVLVALLLVLAGWLAASWWRRYARFRRLELAMPGPRSLPVLGSALEVVGINEDNALDRWLGLWGGRTAELSRFAVFNKLVVFVTDPDHIAKVLRDRRFAEKCSYVYSDLREFIGSNSLVTLGGATWKRRRAAFQPSFHLEVLHSYVEVFAEEAANLVERLRPLAGRDEEFSLELRRALGNAIVATFMPPSANDGVKNRMQESIIPTLPGAVASLSSRMFRPWLWPSVTFNLTASGRQRAIINRAFSDMFDDIMAGVATKRTEEARSLDVERKFGFKGRKSFADLVTENGLSHQEMFDEVKTLGGAAIETASTTLTFAFKMLSIRPDIQRRVFEELCELFHGSDRPVDSADLPK